MRRREIINNSGTLIIMKKLTGIYKEGERGSLVKRTLVGYRYLNNRTQLLIFNSIVACLVNYAQMYIDKESGLWARLNTVLRTNVFH